MKYLIILLLVSSSSFASGFPVIEECTIHVDGEKSGDELKFGKNGEDIFYDFGYESNSEVDSRFVKTRPFYSKKGRKFYVVLEEWDYHGSISTDYKGVETIHRANKQIIGTIWHLYDVKKTAIDTSWFGLVKTERGVTLEEGSTIGDVRVSEMDYINGLRQNHLRFSQFDGHNKDNDLVITLDCE